VAKESNNKWIIIVLIAIALFFFMKQPSVTQDIKTDTPVGVGFEVRSGDLMQAVVGGILTPSAQGQWNVRLTNGKTIPITNIRYSSRADDVAGTGPFEINQFPFTTITSLQGGSAMASPVYSNWTDLEWYATNNPGLRRFTFNFLYDYEGVNPSTGAKVAYTNVPVSGYNDVEILKETCSDTTHINSCNGAGQKCVYQSSSLQLVADQTCCVQAGGTWTGSSCSLTLGCGAIADGACDTTPSPPTPKTLTYCNPSTHVLEQKCGTCHCFDAYGNQEDSCSSTTCVFKDYAGGVQVNVLGGGAGTTCDNCNANDGWVSGTCAAGGCLSTSRQYTRTCTPSGCIPADGLGVSKCVDDPTCVTCSCGSWTDGLCGAGTCTSGQRQQTRTCSPSGCLAETQCVTDANCIQDGLKVGCADSVTSSTYMYGSNYAGQTFTPTTSFSLTKVVLMLVKNGAPTGTLTVGIKATSGGLPTGSYLTSATINENLFTEQTGYYFTYEIPLTAYSVNAGTKYAIQLQSTDSAFANSVGVGFTTSGTYGSGNRIYYTGGSWYNAASDDIHFEVWGY